MSRGELCPIAGFYRALVYYHFLPATENYAGGPCGEAVHSSHGQWIPQKPYSTQELSA